MDICVKIDTTLHRVNLRKYEIKEKNPQIFFMDYSSFKILLVILSEERIKTTNSIDENYGTQSYL